MATDGKNNVNHDDQTELRFRSLLESERIQSFLRRHGLTTHGGVPLRKEEIEKRLRQVDEQNSFDLIAQSVIEKALGIDRPSKKTSQHKSTRDSEKLVKHSPYVTIYDNSCAITMIYCGFKPSRSETLYKFKVQGDEVLVIQYQTSSGSTMVHKSFVKPNDEFTFKSHRVLDTPFTIAIYINGVIESRISTCCEQGYLKHGDRRQKRSLFELSSVTGGTPCYTCQSNELMESSTSDNEEILSESTTSEGSTRTSLSTPRTKISHTPESLVKKNSTKKHKLKSGSELSTIVLVPVEPSNISLTSGSNEIGQLPEAIEKQLMTVELPQAKANEIQTSTTTEKMVSNENTGKDLKNEVKKEDELVNQVKGMMKQTDTTAPKQNQNYPDQKIANEDDDEEGQGTIPSVANHEMQQLLLKYLLLLLPSPKSQIADNETTPVVMATSILNSQESTNVIQQLVVPLPTRSQKEIDSKTIPIDPSQLASQRENVETFVLIWLDITINKNEDTIVSQIKLRAIVNSLITFLTIDETIHFIKNVKEEKVYLIISGSLAWQFIKRHEIKQLSQLDSIYVFCKDESTHKSLMEKHSKVRGIFTDIDPLCARLKEDMKQTVNDLLPISVAPGTLDNNKSGTETQKKEKQVTFLCAQLHRELLFTMEYPDDARLDLVQYCGSKYQDNEAELEFIKELRNEYHTGKAVWWYTRPTFLYKMLNAALFRQDIPMLYKFHFFIKDLHMQLEQLHSLYKPSLKSRTFTVYRGLGMPMKVFDQTIRQEVNNLLAFDTFLSTSLEREVALSFAKNKSIADDESILLEMEIDSDKLQSPFADVSRLSQYGHEDEILFSIGTVFRIDNVSKEKTSDDVWLVRLSSIDENDEQLKNETKQTQITLLNFFKRVCRAQIQRDDKRQIATSYVNMASIYYKQGKYETSLDLYKKALDNLLKLPSSDPLTIATYQSNIGMVHMALEQQDDALQWYEQALQSRIKLSVQNDPLLIDTLHKIGNIYREKKNFDKALDQYYTALEWQPISSEPPLKHNPSSIAATYINIANIQYEKKIYDKALQHFLEALKYQRQHLSEYHPILAFLYNNIGAMYYRLKNYDLALKNHLLTLEIEQRSLPKEHKTLADTYSNIATAYEQLKNYDEAIIYAEKAVDQLKFHLPEDDVDVKKKQVILNRLHVDKDIFQPK